MMIAVLMTCFNRVQVTLKCLEAFKGCDVPIDWEYDVFLVDDASPDKTGKIVKEKYPDFYTIQGTGNLYWCGGMRLAWETAITVKEYDGYLWLNDDSILNPSALVVFEKLHKKTPDSLLVGAFEDIYTKKLTYGFSSNIGSVLPARVQQLTPKIGINGNCVFVPKVVFGKIGFLSAVYQHSRADFDYGWRCLKAGIPVLLTDVYIGNCSRHDHVLPKWKIHDLSIKERWFWFNHPLGVPFKEYHSIVQLKSPWLSCLSWGRWLWLFIRELVK